MDLSDDFPNKRIHDAEEIIEKFDKIIKEIEFKESIIKGIHNNLDGESGKLDIVIADINDIKKLIRNMESNIQKSINDTNEHIDKSIQELLTKLECRIDSIDIPKPPSQNIELLIFMSSTIGLSVGLLLNFLLHKK